MDKRSGSEREASPLLAIIMYMLERNEVEVRYINLGIKGKRDDI